jgi:TetR/AcrR family transcriptional regulator, transcriptional repressor for nem operon
MNAKVDQRERSHETILDSASRLLREKGIAGASVSDVMRGAGLTVGGFYAHFKSKEALIDDALRRTAREMRARLFARLEEKPAADRLEVVVKRYLSSAHRDALSVGCPFPAVVGEIGTTAPAHIDVLADELNVFVSELREHTSAGGALPSRRAAIGLIALMYGGLSLARAVRGTALSDEILTACRALARAARAVDA